MKLFPLFFLGGSSSHHGEFPHTYLLIYSQLRGPSANFQIFAVKSFPFSNSYLRILAYWLPWTPKSVSLTEEVHHVHLGSPPHAAVCNLSPGRNLRKAVGLVFLSSLREHCPVMPDNLMSKLLFDVFFFFFAFFFLLLFQSRRLIWSIFLQLDQKYNSGLSF